MPIENPEGGGSIKSIRTLMKGSLAKEPWHNIPKEKVLDKTGEPLALLKIIVTRSDGKLVFWEADGFKRAAINDYTNRLVIIKNSMLDNPPTVFELDDQTLIDCIYINRETDQPCWIGYDLPFLRRNGSTNGNMPH